jgi:hypothetical protein
MTEVWLQTTIINLSPNTYLEGLLLRECLKIT